MAAIQAKKRRTAETVAAVVWGLLGDPSWETWQGEVNAEWRKLDPEGWHSKDYGRTYVQRYLQQLRDEGRIVVSRRARGPNGGFPRVYYKLAPGARI